MRDGVESTQTTHHADLAHLVERHLAKVEVAGSSPVIRSKKITAPIGAVIFLSLSGLAQSAEARSYSPFRKANGAKPTRRRGELRHSFAEGNAVVITLHSFYCKESARVKF